MDFKRQWSSYWDRADKLARPISGCADSCSVAHLAPWGQRTTQWTDGWLVLASEQKERAVPRQGCPRFINSLCVWYVPFFYPSNYSHKGLILRLLPPTSRLTQWDTRGCCSKLQLIIWTYGMLCQRVRGWGLTSGVSCLGYACHVLMWRKNNQFKKNLVIQSYGLGEWHKGATISFVPSVSNDCFPFVCALLTFLAIWGQRNKL